MTGKNLFYALYVNSPKQDEVKPLVIHGATIYIDHRGKKDSHLSPISINEYTFSLLPPDSYTLSRKVTAFNRFIYLVK